ncbi:MAG: hypothetical protein Ct9H300mP21_00440 [Pseudomonadota bacterium]|nr:MAG: hypothetical protein Ct9H300mP21_00440 [Pseudomonadota bacterium]
MPQKKNPDFAEVIKSKAALAHGFLSSLLGIQKGGLSGYNRDTQATKYLLMDLVRECEVAPIILQGVFESLTINTEKMRELCETDFMNSVDIADHLARKSKPVFSRVLPPTGEGSKTFSAGNKNHNCCIEESIGRVRSSSRNCRRSGRIT